MVTILHPNMAGFPKIDRSGIEKSAHPFNGVSFEVFEIGKSGLAGGVVANRTRRELIPSVRFRQERTYGGSIGRPASVGYDDSMPVSPATAYMLLRSFGLLEFELKRIPSFTGIGPRQSAKVNWFAVDEAVGQLSAGDFLDRVSARTRAKLLGGARNRPKVQVAYDHRGQNLTDFQERDLHASDARALVEATRRVRNNLFHGGKEDPLEEPYPGDDEEWGMAAGEVASLLLDLVREQRLRSVGSSNST